MLEAYILRSPWAYYENRYGNRTEEWVVCRNCSNSVRSVVDRFRKISGFGWLCGACQTYAAARPAPFAGSAEQSGSVEHDGMPGQQMELPPQRLPMDPMRIVQYAHRALVVPVRTIG